MAYSRIVSYKILNEDEVQNVENSLVLIETIHEDGSVRNSCLTRSEWTVELFRFQIKQLGITEQLLEGFMKATSAKEKK